MEEIWKDIEGYEGFYQVSSFGNVRSLDRTVIFERMGKTTSRHWKGQPLKLKLNDYGYFCVHLRKGQEDKQNHITVHCLVAKAFIANSEGKPTVNHKDGVKTNNHYSNLEWSTEKEQIDHAIANGLVELRGSTIYTKEFKQEVKNYFDNNKISIKKLGKLFGISERTAGRISRGEWGDERHLKEDVIQELRNMRELGNTLPQISKDLGVPVSTVYRWVKDIKVDKNE